MNKKATAIALLIMALVGFTMASAVSALPNTVPKPFEPNKSAYKPLFNGYKQKFYENKENNPWDDQLIIYKTYKNKFKDIAIFYVVTKKMETGNDPFFYWQKTLYVTTYITKNGKYCYIRVANYDSSRKKVKEWGKLIINKDSLKSPLSYYNKYWNSLITR